MDAIVIDAHVGAPRCKLLCREETNTRERKAVMNPEPIVSSCRIAGVV